MANSSSCGLALFSVPGFSRTTSAWMGTATAFERVPVMMSAVQGIFNAALYRYACFKQVPAAFDEDLVKLAWTAKT